MFQVQLEKLSPRGWKARCSGRLLVIYTPLAYHFIAASAIGSCPITGDMPYKLPKSSGVSRPGEAAMLDYTDSPVAVPSSGHVCSPGFYVLASVWKLKQCRLPGWTARRAYFMTSKMEYLSHINSRSTCLKVSFVSSNW